jgi:hypothetical protein
VTLRLLSLNERGLCVALLAERLVVLVRKRKQQLDVLDGIADWPKDRAEREAKAADIYADLRAAIEQSGSRSVSKDGLKLR